MTRVRRALASAAMVLAIAIASGEPGAAEPWDPRLGELTSVALAIGGDPSCRANVARSLCAWGRFALVRPGEAEAIVEGEGEGVWVAEGFLGRLVIVDRASGDVLWTATRSRRTAVPGDSKGFEQLVAQLRADLETP